MSIKERLQDDLKQALLAGDKQRVETLRGLKAAILNEEVAQGAREDGLDESAVERLIQREIKKRRESAQLYADNGRQDLADKELREITVLDVYLPAQLNEAELVAIIEELKGQLNVSEAKDMGRLIGAVKQRVGNAADGGTIARLVKSALN